MSAFIRVAGVLVVLVAILSGGVALAKGPADRITVRGPGFDEPIEIVETKVLDAFDPWAGQFLGEVLEKRPSTLSGDSLSYEVLFQLAFEEDDLRVIYAFSYYPGADGHPGYIRLPGPGDEPSAIDRWYRTNIGTITRDTDGRWHEAAQAWGDVMSGHLGEAASTTAATRPSSRVSVTDWSGLWPLLTVLGGVIVAGLAVSRFRLRRRIRAGDRTSPTSDLGA